MLSIDAKLYQDLVYDGLEPEDDDKDFDYVLPEAVTQNDTTIIGRRFEPSEDADDYGYNVTDPKPVEK